MAEKRNKPCQICIGCGRCTATAGDASLRIVAESFLKKDMSKAIEKPEVEAMDEKTEVSEEYFVLLDIGTTTVAMELYNGVGEKQAEFIRLNPQRFFGADVISRISAAGNPMLARQMQASIRRTLEEGLQKFQQVLSMENDTNTVPTEEVFKEITRMYIAGNTTMIYFLTGHDTTPLGRKPFTAYYLQKEKLQIGDCEAVTLPGISAFLGADVLAGVLACGMQESEEISLLIDLGTNGELVLGNCHRMLACSTAAGPAFEGILQAEGQVVWGADIVKMTAELLRKGIMDETGLLAAPYFARGVDIGGVNLAQEHVRNFQTAKAAIATGIGILIREYGIEPKDIRKVCLAGGFGFFLEEEAAIRVGLLPREFQGRIQAVGNSALAGCYAYHFDGEAEQKLEKIKDITEVINLAESENFAHEFVENMNFPAKNK